MKQSKEKLVRDPIHGFIRLDTYPFINEIIATKYFQRLRRISQLGTSSYVYPCATHTRFAHSIGAMHVFWRFFDQVSRYMTYKKNDIENLRKLGTAAILLHDIGHGPLSHASESIFDFKHENITKDIIKNTKIGGILKNAGIDVNKIIEILSRTVSKPEILVSQLITSQLDADRLDYLLRDAYFTGVGYGNIDLERIITVMTFYRGGGYLDGYAFPLYKGRYSIEAYVLSRHLMYQGVYFHKTSRGAELILRRIFKRVKELDSAKTNLFKEFQFLYSRRPTIKDILLLDDNIMFTQITRLSKNDDQTLSKLCRYLLQRELLKAVEVPQDKAHLLFGGEYNKIEKIAKKNKINPEYFCVPDSPRETPYQPYSIRRPDDKETVETCIFVIGENGHPTEISSLSDVVKALSGTKYMYRVYCPAKILGDIKKIFKQD